MGLNRQELAKKVRHFMHVLVHVKGYASPLDMFLKLEKNYPEAC
jgi:hypothetical protein